MCSESQKFNTDPFQRFEHVRNGLVGWIIVVHWRLKSIETLCSSHFPVLITLLKLYCSTVQRVLKDSGVEIKHSVWEIFVLLLVNLPLLPSSLFSGMIVASLILALFPSWCLGQAASLHHSCWYKEGLWYTNACCDVFLHGNLLSSLIRRVCSPFARLVCYWGAFSAADLGAYGESLFTGL